MGGAPIVVLLGPQRLKPTLRLALDAHLAPHAPIAVITAGWEEREAEVGELGEHVGRDVVNLELHRRVEELFEQDPELHAALRRRHDLLSQLQKLYRVRLRFLVPAVEALLRRRGEDRELLDGERASALDNLRALDAHHLRRVAAITAATAAAIDLDGRPSLMRHREEIAEVLWRVQALCVAGGHVGILSNRLWLFALADLLPDTMPLFAWSAGAMAVADRIVLFHDNPPQGRGHAEVLWAGLGLAPGVVPLPHAADRLNLGDRVGVQLLARRFCDSICAALDPETWLTLSDGVWAATQPTRRLTGTGELAAVGAGRVR